MMPLYEAYGSMRFYAPNKADKQNHFTARRQHYKTSQGENIELRPYFQSLFFFFL